MTRINELLSLVATNQRPTSQLQSQVRVVLPNGTQVNEVAALLERNYGGTRATVNSDQSLSVLLPPNVVAGASEVSIEDLAHVLELSKVTTELGRGSEVAWCVVNGICGANASADLIRDLSRISPIDINISSRLGR